jgi:Ran GTPase-activating protein (RanGAP) involved in mRNA processing and transport
MPILCHFILSSQGQNLLKGSRVLELGAGIGVPGILAGRVCAELVLTDSNDAVVERLSRNIQLNRADIACAPGATRVANLLWGAGAFPPKETATPQSIDVVLGSDVVYSASSALALLETADFLMAKPNGVLVLAYIPRWPSVDRALRDAFEKRNLEVTSVPLASFLDTDEASSPDGHALPTGACLLLLRRRDEAASRDKENTTWKIDPPALVTIADHAAMELRVAAEHLDDDAVASSLAEAIGGTSAATSVSVCVNATGPFAVTPQRAHKLGEALGADTCEGRISGIHLTESWLGAEGWATLAPSLKRRAASLVSFSAEGDEIDDAAAAILGEVLAVCANLETVRFARNPLGDAGVEALARNVASFAGLTSLTLSRCDIADIGAAAVAKALPVTLTMLDLSSNEITALGLGDLSAAWRQGKCPALTRLNISGNDVGPGGGAELAEALPTGTPALECLDLRGCSLSDAGLRWLAPALPSCGNLVELHLGSNGVGDGAAVALAEALPGMPRLRVLGLAMNSISGDGAWELVEGIATCASLVSLDLKGNGLGDDGVSAIADALAEVPTLEEVNLSGNDVGVDGALALVECFEVDLPTPRPWQNGLTVIIEGNPEVSGDTRSRLQTAAKRAGVVVKLSALKVTTSGFGR